MKIAYATTFDALDINNWSGTPHHMSHALAKNHDVAYIHHLKRKLPNGFKLKQTWQKYICGQRLSPRFNVTAAKFYSEQVHQSLNNMTVDAIIAPQINPICYLETEIPTVLWTDALYASLPTFYPTFANHSADTIKQGNEITRACLQRVKYAVFSSEWAANTAIEMYGCEKEKVKVIPFGANIASHPTYEQVQHFIRQRDPKIIKFLFLGKHWDRKGGDIVFNVAKALHAQGHTVEVNFVGCMPPKGVYIPPFIKCHGFISKNTEAGMAKIQSLLAESHFLFVPSRAEAFGIVFCEANAYGLPCLTSYTGGIGSVIKDDINGKTFSLFATPEVYCNYISNLMSTPGAYSALALSAYQEYVTRLNWTVTTRQVCALLNT